MTRGEETISYAESDPRVLTPGYGRYPHTRVENMYGITEATVHRTRRTLTLQGAGPEDNMCLSLDPKPLLTEVDAPFAPPAG